MDKKHDFGATTAVNLVWEKAKSKITPKVLWSAIGGLVTVLVVTISWIVNMESDVHQLKETDSRREKSMADMQQKLDILQDIKTQLAVMNGKVDTIADEVDRQREWREHVETVAELPPHVRKRH